MDRILLIGSGNKDKTGELRALLKASGWEVRGLAEYPSVAEPEETEDSFEGNALLKARYYSHYFDVACVADDSGLEVDALNGSPGVYSARYAGETCTYDDNNRKLLAELAGVAGTKRGARFVCVAAFLDEDGREHVERGTVDGTIATACLGSNGFGYDPLFVPEGFDQTFAELAPEVKAGVSHRGRAFFKLCAHLTSLI